MRKKILLIDDDIFTLNYLSEALRFEDIDLDLALNGLDGLKLLKQKPYNLVITDIVMPECDGIEVIIETRRNFPDIPIIAMCDINLENCQHYLFAAEKLGASYCFTKPLPIEAIVNITRQTLTINPET